MIHYRMKSVVAACHGLSPAAARRAIGDGGDAPPVRPSFIGRPGNYPPISVPKWAVTWTIENTADGDWIGQLTWTLLGYEGTFPVVSERDASGEIAPSTEPTYFRDRWECQTQTGLCANRLREQFVESWAEA